MEWLIDGFVFTSHCQRATTQVLLNEEERRKYLRLLRKKDLHSISRKGIARKVEDLVCLVSEMSTSPLGLFIPLPVKVKWYKRAIYAHTVC